MYIADTCSFHDYITTQSLIAVGRKFVRQGTLSVWNVKSKRKKERVMFLFNDILVEAQPILSKSDSLKNLGSLIGRKRSSTLPTLTGSSGGTSTLATAASPGGKDLHFKRSYQLKNLRAISMVDDDSMFFLYHIISINQFQSEASTGGALPHITAHTKPHTNYTAHHHIHTTHITNTPLSCLCHTSFYPPRATQQTCINSLSQDIVSVEPQHLLL